MMWRPGEPRKQQQLLQKQKKKNTRHSYCTYKGVSRHLCPYMCSQRIQKKPTQGFTDFAGSTFGSKLSDK